MKEETGLTKYSTVYDIIGIFPWVKTLQDQHIKALKNCKLILDGGSGPGLITEKLAKLGEDKNIYAIEKNPEMIAEAEKRLKGYNNVKVEGGDVCKLPYVENFFDGYLSNNVTHFVDKEDIDKLLSEMTKVTRPGGIISISGSIPDIDMEFLIGAMYGFLSDKEVPYEVMKKVDNVANLNREMIKQVKEKKGLFDSKTIESKLTGLGCKIINSNENMYLGQNYYICGEVL